MEKCGYERLPGQLPAGFQFFKERAGSCWQELDGPAQHWAALRLIAHSSTSFAVPELSRAAFKARNDQDGRLALRERD